VMMDAHADRPEGVGSVRGVEQDGYVRGPGAIESSAGIVSLVYAAKLIQELGMYDDYTLWMVASVQKEACPGVAWEYLVKADGYRPECVLLTEPTGLRIHRGHPGRI